MTLHAVDTVQCGDFDLSDYWMVIDGGSARRMRSVNESTAKVNCFDYSPDGFKVSTLN